MAKRASPAITKMAKNIVKEMFKADPVTSYAEIHRVLREKFPGYYSGIPNNLITSVRRDIRHEKAKAESRSQTTEVVEMPWERMRKSPVLALKDLGEVLSAANVNKVTMTRAGGKWVIEMEV